MRSSTWWMIGGVVAVIGGLLALFNPLAGTMAATAIAAWAFIIAGVLQVVAGFNASGGWNKAGYFLLGILGIVVGFFLISNPLAGVLALTLAVGALILVSGVVKVFSAKDVKGTSAYGWVIVSGIASFILGIMILAGFPESSVYMLGILLGVELIFDGVAMIGLSSAAKRVEHAIADPA